MDTDGAPRHSVGFELLTGRRAYEEPDTIRDETQLDPALRERVRGTPGSEDRVEAPGEAIDVIARVCAQRPEDRYARLKAIREDLAVLS